MRHRVKTNRLRRGASHRKAMVRNLLTSLFEEGKVKTTDARARVLSQEVEKVIATLKNSKEEHNQVRFLKGLLFSDVASRKLLSEYLASVKDRNSGYTRSTRVGIRKGDAATIVQVELI